MGGRDVQSGMVDELNRKVQQAMADFQTLRRVMVDTQVRPSDVTKFPIIAAMLETPREAFVPDAHSAVAYSESTIALPDGREIMEPRTLAKLLDALDIERTENVLVIGANHGYATALLAHMATSVVAVEPDEAIAAETEEALSTHGVDNAAIIAGDMPLGQPKAGPFDVILIEGGVEMIPESLTEQLADGGRIAAIFVGDGAGEARIGVRVDGRLGWRSAFNTIAPVLPGFTRDRTFAL